MAKRKRKILPPSLHLVAAPESNQRRLLDEQAGNELKALIQQINQANARHSASKTCQEEPELPPAA
jgi:hypothetical protein